MFIAPNINRSAQFGNLKFSTRDNYIEYFMQNRIVKSQEEIWSSPLYISTIHRHWHGEGRNGCIFALLAARKADEVGWHDFVITESFSEIESGNVNAIIVNKINEAIEDPSCQVLSLLFSKIISDEDIVKLIVYLCRTKSILLVDELFIDDKVLLSLRVSLQKESVLSWLMAFGPYTYFPQTRQAPITEIAIRVKPKPEKQFHKLNKEKNAAHLADLPLDYPGEIMEKTWDNTYRRTRLILGEEPNQFSAAKTTLALPKNLWQELNK